ncbi:tetratricopeptide repeat protein [Rhodocaloribacter sp.]
MKKALLFSALLVAALAAVLLTTSRSVEPPAPEAPAAGTDRGDVRRFWSVYRRATAHRMAGRYAEAAAAYDSALVLNEAHEDARYYLGTTLAETGRFAEARAAWRRMTEHNPHSARAFAQLGRLSLCLPDTTVFDLDAAGEAFARAMAINPEETGPPLRLAEIALLRNDDAAAERYLDAVLGSHKRSVEALVLAGYLAWKRGRAAEAAAALARATESTRPPEAPGGVPGEGDTRPGAPPNLSSHVSCPAFQPLLDAAKRLSPTPDAAETEAFFTRIDRLFARLRLTS